MHELDEITREFLVESYENLDQLDRDLVALEEDPTNRERLASIFRTVHTIKGTCGFLNFARLGAVAHAGEGLLSRLRDGRLRLNPETTSGLLALVDAIREMLAAIEATGREGEGDYTALLATLDRLREGNAPPPEEPAGPGDPEANAPAAGGLSEGNIRVGVGLLDKLMTLVGELVLARNQILQCATPQGDPTLLRACQRLNLITTELQEGVMKTRMQPITTVWNKFPRVVRDLALACGKQVRVDMEGGETELDRSVLEAIKDPLTHLVRNAVDHGLETPEGRKERGKPAEGRLLLRAFHESGQVNIEIADDGAGIDLERVRQQAVERGLVPAEQAGRLTGRELTHLIFLPGLSTAGRVTSVSGRGVGMDVVKTNVERIGGTVDVDTRPGRGTTVKIKIPLTLAIIPALLVRCGGDRYAIPQAHLLEVVRLEGEQARRGIEWVHDTPVHRLRGSLLPLVDLRQELKVPGNAPGVKDEVVNLVVLQADARPFGLVVEGILDTTEIVVKPLARPLKEIPVFAGATILGDGRVALILDVQGLARGAGVIAGGRDRPLPEQPAPGPEVREDRPALLLLGMGERRLAVPLTQVARLEEFPRTVVERSADREVVQYRGGILPLVRLAGLLPGEFAAPDDRDSLQVVVYAGPGPEVGLVVDRILDVVREGAGAPQPAACPGLLGSAVIQQRVTGLLDVPGLLGATAAPRGTSPAR